MGMLAKTAEGQSTAAKMPRALPLAEPGMGLDNRQFAEWFRLFLQAVEHEMGNSLSAFRAFAQKHGREGEELANRLFDEYNRLRFLQSLISRPIDDDRRRKFSCMFPEEQFDIRDLDEGTLFIQIRCLSLKSVRSLRSSLAEADSLFHDDASRSEDQKFHFERAIVYGNLLCHALEKLIVDDSEFSYECIPLKISGRTSVLSSSRSAGAEAGLGVKISMPETELLSEQVVSNPLFLRLILANIFSNAKRAMEIAGSEKTIQISVARQNGAVCIRYADSGCGMDAKTMEKLNAGIQTSTKEGEGHGIGFRYCRALAERLGGRLYIESSGPGQGTTVALELAVSG